MSFLDNLESSLKNLESRDERDVNAHQRRTDERARSLAAAPWAEKLKSSPYTKALLDKAVAQGHQIRAKVYMAWFDGKLRLEARQQTLELRPSADGIFAEFTTAEGKFVSVSVDLSENPDDLLAEWFRSVPALKPEPVEIEEEADNE
jgi:hypothetical protein